MSPSGLNGWYVVHEERQTLLYHGFYRSISDDKDKKETARAQADLKRCKSLSTDDGRLFRDVMFVTLEGMIVRIPADSIPTQGRGTQGVHLVNTRPEDRVVSARKVVRAEDAELAAEEAASRAAERRAVPDLARADGAAEIAEEEPELDEDPDEDVDLDADESDDDGDAGADEAEETDRE